MFSQAFFLNCNNKRTVSTSFKHIGWGESLCSMDKLVNYHFPKPANSLQQSSKKGNNTFGIPGVMCRNLRVCPYKTQSWRSTSGCDHALPMRSQSKRSLYGISYWVPCFFKVLNQQQGSQISYWVPMKSKHSGHDLSHLAFGYLLKLL